LQSGGTLELKLEGGQPKKLLNVPKRQIVKTYPLEIDANIELDGRMQRLTLKGVHQFMQ
jgi:hypothetical protein